MKSDSGNQNPDSVEQADESSSILMPVGFAGSKNTSSFIHSASSSAGLNESKDGPPRLNLKG